MTAKILRPALVVLCAFLALTAIPSAFLVVPALPIEWLRGGPFSDYTIPAIALGVIGVLGAVAALGLVSAPQLGTIAAVAAGAAIAIFEVVEVAVVGIALVEYPDMPQSWLQPLYFVLGVAIVLLGLAVYSPSTVVTTVRSASQSSSARPV